MGDDFTLKFVGTLSVDDQLKAIQSESICILGTRFPITVLIEVDALRDIIGSEEAYRHWTQEDTQKIMLLLLTNAAESLKKQNPFPTFVVKGTLSKESLVKQGYGSGFYIFHTKYDAGNSFCALAYCDLDGSLASHFQIHNVRMEEGIMIYHNVTLDKEGDDGETRVLEIQWGGENHTHEVSFLGTSCADSSLKHTGIINWLEL